MLASVGFDQRVADARTTPGDPLPPTPITGIVTAPTSTAATLR